MINRLIPEQIANLWYILKPAIAESLPPYISEHEDRMNRILTSCLCCQAEVWVYYDRLDDSNITLRGVAVTRIMIDDISNTKSLLIYALYGYGSLSDKFYLDGLKSIADYAKSKKCSNIIAYTTAPAVAKLAKHLGAEVSFFLTFKSIQNL